MSVGTAKAKELTLSEPDETQALQRHGTVAIAFVALCDSVAPLGYMFLGTAHPIHAAAITLKFMALLIVGRRGTLSRPVLLWFFLVLFLFVEGIALDLVNLGTFHFESTRYLAVIAHIGLTLLLIPPDRFRTYAKWVVAVPFATFVVHIALAHLGQIQNVYGRWLYLGNSHPNLGGEIGAAVILAAALSLKVRYFLPVALVIGYSCILMQTRAALLVICLVTAAYLWLGLPKRQRLFTLLLPGIAVPTLVFLALITSNGTFEQVVDYIANEVFLANNPYRGIGTGFVGRDVLWAKAWHLFEQHPLTGVGFAYFQEFDASSPHNAFLYGLAMHGVWSILFWCVVSYIWLIIIRRSLAHGTLFLCFFPMLLLNDRFINMNPYPILIYEFLFFYYQICNKTRAQR